MRDFKICKGCFSQFYLENNSSLLIRNLQYRYIMICSIAIIPKISQNALFFMLVFCQIS